MGSEEVNRVQWSVARVKVVSRKRKNERDVEETIMRQADPLAWFGEQYGLVV
jgi:hypothetical protein